MSQQSLRKKWRALLGAIVLGALVVALSACAAQQASSSSSEGKSALSATSDTPMLVVPNVVSLTMSDAEKSIVASGFKLGDVKHEKSETVPRGNVISQTPEALATNVEDRTISITVSSGKPKPKKVEVPSVKGMNQAAAEKALKDAGLIGICDGWVESSESDPGTVFKQSVDAGTKVTEDTKVTFTIALAPKTTTVPDLSGLTEKEAENKLAAADLSFDIVSAYSDDVAEGLVMGQSYGAGAEVQIGTTVSVTMSLGPKPSDDVTVPYVYSYSWSDAEWALESAGLVARYTGDPSGVVVDQDYDGGTVVPQGTVVTLTLSTPDPMVEVPNLIGMTVTAAENTTDNLGLSLDGGNYGVVVDQVPAAGTYVEPGSTVSIDTDDAPIGVQSNSTPVSVAGDDAESDYVEVPNFIGMSAESAGYAADAAEVSLDGDSEGTVIDQTPAPGTMIERNGTVSIETDADDE